jgi:hypothetical protein
MQKSYNSLIEKLNSFIREYYKNQITRGFIYSLISTFLLLIAISTLEYLVFFNSSIRTLFFWTYCAVSLIIVLKYIIIPLIKMFQLAPSLSHEEAAQIIGTHFKEISDKLTNILELRELDKGSQALINASIKQKSKEFELVPFNKAINWSKTARYSKYLIIPIVLTIVLIGSGNEKIITESTNRIINYNIEYEKPAPFTFNITNKELSCVENSDLIIEVNTSGLEIPKDIYINYNDSKYKLQKKSAKEFRYKFKNISRNINFFLSGNETSSKQFSIVVLGRPIIEQLNIEITPPSHTKLNKDSLLNTGSISIPEGSIVKWNIKSKKADSMYFELNSLTERIIGVGDFFYIQKTITNSSQYAISLANKDVQFIDTVFYNIKVIKDAFPIISIKNKNPLDSAYSFVQVLIKDDYGFKDLTLHRRLYGLDRDTLIAKKIPISNQSNSQLLLEDVRTTNLSIKAGESVDWYFILRDNDKPSGYKSVTSQTITFSALSYEEVESQYNEINNQIKQAITEDMQALEEIQESLLDFEKILIKKDSLDWRDKKKINDILEKQKALDNRIEKLKKMAQDNFEKINHNSSPSEKILEKQKELQKLFDEIMPEEMKKLYEELNKLKESLDKNQLQQQIEELKLSNEDIEKELDRNLELLKQFEFNEQLDQIINKLKKLEKEQTELSKKEHINSDSIQKKNIQEFQDIKKDIKNIKELNSQLDNKQKIKDTDDLEQQIEEQLKEGNIQLEENKTKSAQKSQKKASQTIKSLEKTLSSMQKENKESKQEEDIEVLRQILENLVYFSIEQENLFLQFDMLNADDPYYIKLMHEQQSLINSAKIIKDSLFSLSKRVPQISSKINREINALNKKSLSTIAHLRERETSKAVESQQFIMTSANNLAVLLSAILEQLQKEMSSDLPSTQQCEKPGKGKPKPGDLKKMQKELNEHLKKMQQEMKNGKPNEKGKGGKSKELVEMIARQELIRQTLDDIRGGIEDEDILKSLDDAIQNMEITEQDIANNRITQELIDRQAKIMTRMLEIDNAIQEQGEKNKRESQTATEYEKIIQDAFEKYEEEKLKQTEMLKSMPPNLKEYYKEKTNRYFNLIL